MNKTLPTPEIRQKKFRESVLEKYNHRCAYCGCFLDYQTLQVDHIVPKAQGGTDDMHNLNPSCQYCNSYKGHSGLETFRMYLKQLLNERYEYMFRSTTKMQVALQFGAIELKQWDGRFYFEKEI